MTDTPDDDGGQAFPWTDTPGKLETHTGMSLRDWFAGQALAGLCAPPNFINTRDSNVTQAAWAYELADAMLEARKRTKGA